MKVKILFDDFKDNAPMLAKAISEEINERCEHIPPAFPPKGEKMIFFGLELKGGKLSKEAKIFLPIITPARTIRVALFSCGTKQEKGLQIAREMLEKNGVEVIAEVFMTEGKKGKGVVPVDSDVIKIKAFAKAVVDAGYCK